MRRPPRPPRIYSETAPYEAVIARDVLAALARRKIELVLAVRPWDLVELPRTAARIADAGVVLSLWPMLTDDDGRFLHVGNVARMRELALRAIEAARGDGAPVSDVMLDVEPPVEAMRSVLHASFGPILSSAVRGMRLYQRASAATLALRRRLEGEGVSVSAAVTPHVLVQNHDSLSRFFGGVATDIFPALDVMAYTTLMSGYSRGLVDRRRSLRLLGHFASRASNIESVRIGLGCVGLGAMGDEATFGSPAELAKDVAVVRRAGVVDLALLDLGGVLARPPIDGWLDAFAS